MLRGDIVKDDSGACAVFTEKGSSASQMTAAKIMDVIARLPGGDGQAADAVSAYTHIKLEDAQKLLKIPKSESLNVWIRLPRHKWRKSLEKIEDPVVPLERISHGHLLPGLPLERHFEQAFWELGWEKIPNWECMFVHRKQGLFLSENVDDIKMAGKKQNMAPTWKKLMKNVDIDEPTSFLDHVYLGCTLGECKPTETVIEQHTTMFGSRISAGATRKLPGWEKPQAQTVAWSHDMEGHAQKCVERYCELAKKVEQHYKVSHPCLDDHQFKKEELESVGELSEVCSQIVLKCLYMARFGRLDILFSVNKLARAVTKWTQACDN